MSEGSLFKVPVTTVRNVLPHPNAERLEILEIYGFHVVAKKGLYQKDSLVIYAPVDSILTHSLEKRLFPDEKDPITGEIKPPKIKLNHSRIRQIRIRGYPSQGMVINPSDVRDLIGDKLKLEEDLAEKLEITKYDPVPQKGPQEAKPRNKPKENPRFHKYGGVDALKWTPDFFEGKQVIVQEKLHGSCCRAAYLPSVVNTLGKKIKKFFGLLPKFEYTWGSNNVQLQERDGSTGYYGEDVYKKVLDKVDAFKKLKPGETIFGELIGPGIQKNYTYGHKEHHFVLYDVKVQKEDGSQEYLNPEEAEKFASERGFDFVPVLYAGEWDKTMIESLSIGPSVYEPSEKVREGVVIKLRYNYGEAGGKAAKKLISPIYLDDVNNSDNH